MGKRILVLGATGLVGSQCIEALLVSPSVSCVYALTRRKISLKSSSKLHQIITDFADLDKQMDLLAIDAAICTLGTTIKAVNSQEQFFAIEHDIPLKVAQCLKLGGCSRFIYLSSVGADKSSSNFYLNTKGQIEASLADLSFQKFIIVRPSLLLGKRSERRIAEDLGKAFAALFNWCIPKRYRAVESSAVAKRLSELAIGNTREERTVYENEHIIEAE